MTIGDEQIARLRALEKAATPGPWTDCVKAVKTKGGPLIADTFWHPDARPYAEAEANAALIAEARNALHALLDALEAERKRADEAQKSFETYTIMYDDSQRSLKEMMDQRDTALAEIERLKAALKPFAMVAAYDRGNSPFLTDADFEAARAALQSDPSEKSVSFLDVYGILKGQTNGDH